MSRSLRPTSPPGRRFALHLGVATAMVIGFVGLLASPVVAAPAVNGGFETGDFTGWTVANPCGEPGEGDWFVYSGTTTPLGSSVAAPPQGTYAATTDQVSPGTHILYQDIAVESGGTSALTFSLYYENGAGDFVTPDTLDCSGEQANQQYRVDLVSTTAAIDSVAGTDVLESIFRTEVGAPSTLSPTPMNVDLTEFAGQTVRLRFAEVDNLGLFQASVDNVVVSHTAAQPDVSVSVSDSADPVSLGGPNVTYTVAVANSGSGGATGVSVATTLSGASSSIVSSSTTQGSCSPSGSTLTCSLGSLAASGTASITVTVTPNATGTITATAVATLNETDANSANNTDAENTTVNNNLGCTIVGTSGNDTITGTNGADVICGLGGNDSISGGNGNDTIYAGDGDDAPLNGGNGDDTIYGGPGNDSSYGEGLLQILDNGSDTLFGGPGNDTLDGQYGNDVLSDTDTNDTDTLSGNLGNDNINVQDGATNDTANGGLGSDTCTIDTIGLASDTTTSC